MVVDAHSRRVIDGAVAGHLGASLAVEALRMALAERRPAPGLIHHSDRGMQYACADYLTLLADHSVQPIFSSKINCPQLSCLTFGVQFTGLLSPDSPANIWSTVRYRA